MDPIPTVREPDFLEARLIECYREFGGGLPPEALAYTKQLRRVAAAHDGRTDRVGLMLTWRQLLRLHRAGLLPTGGLARAEPEPDDGRDD